MASVTIMASVTYGKRNLWQRYYGKRNYGKDIMANETEPNIILQAACRLSHPAYCKQTNPNLQACMQTNPIL